MDEDAYQVLVEQLLPPTVVARWEKCRSEMEAFAVANGWLPIRGGCRAVHGSGFIASLELWCAPRGIPEVVVVVEDELRPGEGAERLLRFSTSYWFSEQLSEAWRSLDANRRGLQ